MKIKKSQIDRIDNFHARAETFAKDLKEWSDREKLVERDKKAKVPADKAYVSCPRPSEEALVEAAVQDDFTVYYEVDDDVTPPPPTLDEKKAKLINAVTAAEYEAISAVCTPSKRRLLELKVQDIAAADASAVSDVARQIAKLGSDRELFAAYSKIVASIPDASSIASTMPHDDAATDAQKAEEIKRLSDLISDPEAYKKSKRSDADNATLATYADVIKATEKVHRRAIEICAEVEDLTADNVDSYVVPSFDA